MELQNIQVNPVEHRLHLFDSRINKQSDHGARIANGDLYVLSDLYRHVTGALSMKHAANSIGTQCQSLFSVPGSRDAADLDAHGQPPSPNAHSSNNQAT